MTVCCLLSGIRSVRIVSAKEIFSGLRTSIDLEPKDQRWRER